MSEVKAAGAVDVLPSHDPDGSEQSGSRSWAKLENPEDIRAFVAGASAKELREMGELLRAGNELPPEWAVVQARIATAVNVSEGLVRRLTAGGAPKRRHPGQSPAAEFWKGTRP